MMLKQPGTIESARASGWLAVFVLSLVYALAYVDRQILSLLVSPIKADLAISDTGFSLLHGLSFALFYAIFGMPIGLWVDRGNRPRILAAGVALWSLFTCLCGVSRQYWQLFLFRLGVGIGEATVVPVTYSLVGDYFEPRNRGLAMGVFGSGIYVGMGAALLIGGALVAALNELGTVTLPLVGDLRPWQLTLVAVGAPGLLLALATLLLAEPRNVTVTKLSAERTGANTLGAALRAARGHYRSFAPAIVLHHLTVTFMVMALYAILAWTPEYFRRSFGVEPSDSGFSIGLVVIAAGTVGVIGGGAVSDALLNRGVRAGRLVVLAVSALLAIPAALLFSLSSTAGSALAWLALTLVLVSTLSAAGPAALQDIFPPELRGTGAAVYQLVANLVGLGLGPTAVALVTDFVHRDVDKLHLSLAMTIPPMLVLATGCALAGLGPYESAVAHARPETRPDGRLM